jgi:hypothetical protein
MSTTASSLRAEAQGTVFLPIKPHSQDYLNIQKSPYRDVYSSGHHFLLRHSNLSNSHTFLLLLPNKHPSVLGKQNSIF